MTSSVSWERVAQETKRARAAYQSACELKNAVARERAANKKRKRVTALSARVTQTEWQVSIARTILDWAFDYIPDKLWVPAVESDTISAESLLQSVPPRPALPLQTPPGHPRTNTSRSQGAMVKLWGGNLSATSGARPSFESSRR